MITGEHLNRLLDISDSILLELENEDPSINSIKDCYAVRASLLEQIKKDSAVISENNPDSTRQNEVSKLLNLFQQKEMVINKKLISLRRSKETKLKQLYHDRKAESVYKNQLKRKSPLLISNHLQG